MNKGKKNCYDYNVDLIEEQDQKVRTRESEAGVKGWICKSGYTALRNQFYGVIVYRSLPTLLYVTVFPFHISSFNELQRFISSQSTYTEFRPCYEM